MPLNLLALYNGIELPRIGPTMALHTIPPLLVLVELDSCIVILNGSKEWPRRQITQPSAQCTTGWCIKHGDGERGFIIHVSLIKNAHIQCFIHL